MTTDIPHNHVRQQPILTMMSSVHPHEDISDDAVVFCKFLNSEL